MSEPQYVKPVRLIISMMYDLGNRGTALELLSVLEDRYGTCEAASPEYDFDFTNFYQHEFGRSLKKTYFCFCMIKPDALPIIKRYCFELEQRYSSGKKRLVNIDVGYLSETSLVLATFKPRPHRIYLRAGVYADLELVYEKKEWKSFSWTFPDLKTDIIKEFLNKIKNYFLQQPK
ncbi:MAG: DUF4416 family protein [archaeon]